MSMSLAWLDDVDEIVVGSLFSGYGGLDQGLEAALAALFPGKRVRVAWVADIDPGASRILAVRYPGVPNLGDITRVDWTTVERVDIVTGGFPCQDVSHAGNRAGLRPDTRSGLWSQMSYAISILRPLLVVAENVRGLLSAAAASDVEPCPWCLGETDGEPPVRALGAVLADLAGIGYDARWIGLRASDVGAPHARFRVFVVAYPQGDRLAPQQPGGPESECARSEGTPGDAAQDPDGAARSERRVAAPGQAEGRRARADARRRGGAPAADAGRAGAGRDARGLPCQAQGGGRPGLDVCAAVDAGHDAAADPDSDGLSVDRRVDSRGRDAHGCGRPDEPRDDAEPAAQWGPYGPAVERWAHVVGRPAPAPTVGGRLSPRFVEWMMGLPDGWVTDVPDLSRAEQLKALGNGVVPLQAAFAVSVMLSEAAA